MNWKARLRNKAFWVSAVSFIVLVIKSCTKMHLPDNLDEIVNAALVVASGAGIIIDPTTPGITDK